MVDIVLTCGNPDCEAIDKPLKLLPYSESDNREPKQKTGFDYSELYQCEKCGSAVWLNIRYGKP